jgi:hypothetical protein
VYSAMNKLIRTDISYSSLGNTDIFETVLFDYPCEIESLLDWRGMVLPRRHPTVLQNTNYNMINKKICKKFLTDIQARFFSTFSYWSDCFSIR